MDTSKKHKTGDSTEAETEVHVVSSALSKPKMSRKRLIIIISAVVIALVATGFVVYQQLKPEKVAVQDAGYQENIEQIKATRPADNAPAQERADYYTTLGAAYASADNNEQAITALKQAEDLYTKPAEKYGVWYNLAKAYETTGQKKEAVTYYKKSLDFAQHPPEGEQADADLINNLSQKIKQLGG